MVLPGEVAAHQSSQNEDSFLCLQAFREDVIGHHVTAMCDNSTVVAYSEIPLIRHSLIRISGNPDEIRLGTKKKTEKIFTFINIKNHFLHIKPLKNAIKSKKYVLPLKILG